MGRFSTEQADGLLTPEAKHRQRKRALGICGWDGCPVEAGDRYYCQAHREREAARQKARRQLAKGMAAAREGQAA